MPSTISRPTDLIIGRGLLSAEAVASELRRRLLRELTRNNRFRSQGELLELARKILWEFEPLLAENLLLTDLAAWVAGMDSVANKLPEWAIQSFGSMGGSPRPPTSFIGSAFGGEGDDEPIVRFPLLERAAKSLAERHVMRRDQFDRLTDAERAQAFTMAGESSLDVLETIRNTLAEDVDEGTSLRTFRARLADRIDTSKIGAGHLENVYRTNVQAAFRDGYETLAADPIVSDIFPYQEYLAIRDARAREDHLALEFLGLNGTSIYRRDDPMWDYFSPPWDYQCRCGTNPLTIEAAARRGVQEAQEWLRTGRPPANPEWRLQFIPFRPAPGFGARRKQAA